MLNKNVVFPLREQNVKSRFRTGGALTPQGLTRQDPFHSSRGKSDSEPVVE